MIRSNSFPHGSGTFFLSAIVHDLVITALNADRAGVSNRQSTLFRIPENKIPIIVVEFGIPLNEDSLIDVAKVIVGFLNTNRLLSISTEVTISRFEAGLPSFANWSFS